MGSNAGTTIKGAVSIAALAGNDGWLLVGPGRVLGNLTANMGAGTTGSFQVSANFSSIDVAGTTALNFSGVTGALGLTLSRCAFQGAFAHTGGGGVDTASVANSMFRGNTTFNTGLGNDILSLNDTSFLGTLGIQTGIGMDTVNIENDGAATGRSIFHKAVTISTGDDADTIIIAGNVVARTAEFKAAITLDGGAGADTFTPGVNIIGSTPTQINI